MFTNLQFSVIKEGENWWRLVVLSIGGMDISNEMNRIDQS